MRQGVLSDEHVMKHCAYLQPIPMKITDKLLHQDLNVHKETPFTVKKLKYQNAISRPTNFNTLANSLTRIAGNDVSVKEHLVKGFLREIQQINVNDGNGGYQSNGNGTESTASDPEVRLPGHYIQDELARRATEFFAEMAEILPATPMSFPKLDEDEYRRRSGRMNADDEARREAYADPEIAARAETTPGMTVLRNRAFQSPAAREEARRAHNESLTNLAPGLEVNSPAYMQALERAEEAYLTGSPRYNSPDYNRMLAQAAGASGLNF